MKKLLFIFAVTVIVGLAACHKKDKTESKTSILMSGSWIVTAATHDNDGNGTYETDDFAGFPTCFKDNIWTFQGNGVLQMDEGSTKCDPGDPQSDATTWQLTNTETTLVIDGESYSIEELSNVTLRFKQVLAGNRSSMVTFRKR